MTDIRKPEKKSLLLLFTAMLLVLLPIPETVKGEYSRRGDWFIQTRDINSGLPHNTVRAILHASSGYIYLGTPAGLVKTDGVRMECFNRWNTPELENSSILSLHEGLDGRLMAGTAGGGIFILEDSRWKEFEMQEKLLNKYIRAIESDLQGNIWIGTEYRLYRLGRGGEITSYGLDDGLPDNLITDVAVDSAGYIWVGMMQGGLAEFKDGLVRTYGLREGLLCPEVLSIAAGHGERIWIGTMEGLFVLNTGTDVISPAAIVSPVTSLALRPGSNTVLAGTMTEGIVMIEPGREADKASVNIMENTGIHSILTFPDGRIWAGTEGSGLFLVSRREVGSIEIPGEEVFPLIAGSGGTIWAGTGRNGLVQTRNGKVKKIIDGSKGFRMVRALFSGEGEKLWVGTRNNGLTILEGEDIHKIPGLLSDNITSITRFEDRVWIGTDRGLNTWKDGETSRMPVLDGLDIRTLYQDERENLLAGTDSGLWKITGSSAVRINAASLDSDILCIHRGRDGLLWIGTNGSGLGQVRSDSVLWFTREDGLPGNFIYSITESAPGNIWASCENGVFRVSVDSLNGFAEGRIQAVMPTLFDRTEGMPSSQCSGYCSPAFALSEKGELLYPTRRGIAVIEPGEVHHPPPVVTIEGITSGSGLSREKTERSFDNNTEWVKIEFTAFEYAAPGKIAFLYKLKGYDREFNLLNPGTARSAVYRNLPTGDYEFRVFAIGRGSSWSERAASVNFTIMPPLYLRPVFLAVLGIAVVITAGALATSVIIRRKRREKKKYSTTVIDRERRDEALAELELLMNEEKLFLDPDLNLRMLSGQLRIHSNYLSRIINEEFGVNFNDYINRHRIEEACRMLRRPENSKKNITEIMYQCGFYSKSTFNTAFKKITGTTPSRYRRNRS